MNDLNTLIQNNKSDVAFALSQFQIFDDPSVEVVQDAFKKFGNDFLSKLMSIFRSKSSYSNQSQIGYFDPSLFNQPANTNGGGSTGGGFWNWANNILGLAQQGANIYSTVKDTTGQQQPLFPTQPQQQTPIVMQTGAAGISTPLIIAGVAVTIIIILILILKK